MKFDVPLLLSLGSSFARMIRFTFSQIPTLAVLFFHQGRAEGEGRGFKILSRTNLCFFSRQIFETGFFLALFFFRGQGFFRGGIFQGRPRRFFLGALLFFFFFEPGVFDDSPRRDLQEFDQSVV